MGFVPGATLIVLAAAVGAVELDERPAGPGEWGYRPETGTISEVSPPGFTWRPQNGLEAYQLEVHRGDALGEVVYTAEVAWNVHCPPEALAPGEYTWRYRGRDAAGEWTAWSQPRTFQIAADARPLPLPPRDELLARIPRGHPRLFLRPEDLPNLRARAQGDLKADFDALTAACEKLLADPPPTAEPLKYPEGMVRGSDEWRAIWWGNREYTIRALNGAATLAFTWLLGGREEYGQLARRILLDCAAWDPKGATGYRYNDEAGMPYNWGFSRTYTFVHDLLTEDERALCRRVMKVRGDEMYAYLFPRHLWRPYDSHANRAWHKLGEIGIAFLGEVEGAEDWVWFATNVFYCVYPVWCDDDGGWHEGSSYWASYISRFTWWADIMRAAFGINAYDKPYFSRIGYYPLYLMPPGMADGGFGDLCENRKAEANVTLMSDLAAQANNGHWQWYVEQLGGRREVGGYVGFVRGALPPVAATAPDDLPTSRLFRGTGQAYLNSTLTDAREGVQVVFKSSPFGTQSHGYEANNSFLLWGYGERLLIRTGRRDSYGSEHHRNWMWSTRSVNNITVDGIGQRPHSAATRGAITRFATTPALDLVEGEAGECYRVAATDEEKARGITDRPLLSRYTRTIVFAKPELVVVYDRLVATRPATFTYWLHAIDEMAIPDQHHIVVRRNAAACDIDLMAPDGLQLAQTDQYDPNPRERVKVREWHLTADTLGPRERVEFVALYRPRRAADPPVEGAELTLLPGGYALRATLRDGELVALLPADDGAALEAHGLRTVGGTVVAQRRAADHTVVATVGAEP